MRMLIIEDENPEDQDIVYYVGPNVMALERKYGFPPEEFRLWLAAYAALALGSLWWPRWAPVAAGAAAFLLAAHTTLRSMPTEATWHSTRRPPTSSPGTRTV